MLYAPPTQGLDNGLESAITINEVREAVLSSPLSPSRLRNPSKRGNVAMNVQKITIPSYICGLAESVAVCPLVSYGETTARTEWLLESITRDRSPIPKGGVPRPKSPHEFHPALEQHPHPRWSSFAYPHVKPRSRDELIPDVPPMRKQLTGRKRYRLGGSKSLTLHPLRGRRSRDRLARHRGRQRVDSRWGELRNRVEEESRG